LGQEAILCTEEEILVAFWAFEWYMRFSWQCLYRELLSWLWHRVEWQNLSSLLFLPWSYRWWVPLSLWWKQS